MTLFRKLLRIALIGAAVLVIVLAAGAVWRLAHRDPETSAPDVHPTADLVARGEYLARVADCAACHNAEGGKPFAGGRPFKLPFGTIYSTNITADAQTGIGAWSDDDFVRALHRGVARDGSHLYPAFPYTAYTGMSRDDAVAIKAYLFSLPRVHAPARPNSLYFPFNQRWAMGIWNLAFVDERRFRPDQRAGAVVNRGNYLANVLGHCGECHTPRTLAFSLANGRRFAGAPIEGWRAYNITADKTYGVGAWSDQDLADYLTKGHAAGRGAATGPMGEAVDNSLRYWTPSDMAALISYLRTVPARGGQSGTEIDSAPASVRASSAAAPGKAEGAQSMGARIFEGACASCHQWNGAGQQDPAAGLAGSAAVNDPAGPNLVRAILAGASVRGSDGLHSMPSFARAYSDTEIAAVANYAISHFGGKTGRVTPAQVAKARRGE